MTSQSEHRCVKARSYTHCQACGEPKTIPKKFQKGVTRLDFERDPYCSTSCAKLAHGVSTASSPTTST